MICQPLLAAKVYEVELHPWQYHSVLMHAIMYHYGEGNTIKVGLQPIVPPEIEGSLQANQVEAKVKEEPSEEEYNPPLPPFGPCQILPRIIILMIM